MTTTKARTQDSAVIQNAFAGRARKPNDNELASALGPTLDLWKGLVADLQRDQKIDIAAWHSPSPKYGWSLRLSLKKRNIVYLGPRQGFFIAAFALGDKAVAAARNIELPPPIQKLIAEAKRYAEGTAVRIEVRTPEDAVIVKELARIKIQN